MNNKSTVPKGVAIVTIFLLIICIALIIGGGVFMILRLSEAVEPPTSSTPALLTLAQDDTGDYDESAIPLQRTPIAESGIQVLNYEFLDTVDVFSQIQHSVVLHDGILTITVYNPSDDVLNLTVGDTFVLEPTYQQPEGVAGILINSVMDGSVLIITARQPESLSEIFYEFELIAEIDLLYHATEILLGYDLTDEDEVIITRNHNDFVKFEFVNFTRPGISITGELTIFQPTVQVNIISRGLFNHSVNYFVVQANARCELNVEARGNVDRLFTVVRIPVRIAGTGFTVSGGVRVTGSGHAVLDFEVDVATEFGIRDNNPVADVNLTYSLEKDIDAVTTLTLNVRAMATVFFMDVYGVHADFGKGVRINTQNRCPINSCVVFEIFHVRTFSSLRDGWLGRVQALQFHRDFARERGLPERVRYLYGGRFLDYCPHEGMAAVTYSHDSLLVGLWELVSVQNMPGGGATSTMIEYFPDGTGRRHLLGSWSNFEWHTVGNRLYATGSSLPFFYFIIDEPYITFDYTTHIPNLYAVYIRVSAQADDPLPAQGSDSALESFAAELLSNFPGHRLTLYDTTGNGQKDLIIRTAQGPVHPQFYLYMRDNNTFQAMGHIGIGFDIFDWSGIREVEIARHINTRELIAIFSDGRIDNGLMTELDFILEVRDNPSLDLFLFPVFSPGMEDNRPFIRRLPSEHRN